MTTRSRRTIGTMVTLVLVGLASSSCSHWQRQWIAPALVVERDHPTILRVTRTDGTRLEIMGPTIAGDSLVGTPANTTSQGGSLSVKPAVALQKIEYVEAKRAKSAPAILFLGLLLPVTTTILIAATWD
jgi:hypothetical protein